MSLRPTKLTKEKEHNRVNGATWAENDELQILDNFLRQGLFRTDQFGHLKKENTKTEKN